MAKSASAITRRCVMHDWRGSRVRADALTVPCRDCNVPAGEPCVVRDSKGGIEKPLEAFPAHPHRINDSKAKEGDV